MSDLSDYCSQPHLQREHRNPDPRVVYTTSPLVTLTAEQRALAQNPAVWLVAERIRALGKEWFSESSLRLTGVAFCPRTADMERLGIISRRTTRDGKGVYWKHTPTTWPWLNTALAFRDESTHAHTAQKVI